jgi:hypothetical protein
MATRIKRGGAVVRGLRGSRGWSWKGGRGAPTRSGARGGDGRAGWTRVRWSASASTQHEEKQRWGVSERRG